MVRKTLFPLACPSAKSFDNSLRNCTEVRRSKLGTWTHGFVVVDSHDQRSAGRGRGRRRRRTSSAGDGGRGGRGLVSHADAGGRDSLAIVVHSLDLTRVVRSFPSVQLTSLPTTTTTPISPQVSKDEEKDRPERVALQGDVPSTSCMSAASRVERPTLQGQRIKTRKRDEKEKYDPGGFRDSIIAGINEIITGSKNSSPDSETVSLPSEASTAGEPEQNGGAAAPAGPLVTKARLDALSKWLDERGNKKDDYRKYGEVLFDVLVAGGILGQFPVLFLSSFPHSHTLVPQLRAGILSWTENRIGQTFVCSGTTGMTQRRSEDLLRCC